MTPNSFTSGNSNLIDNYWQFWLDKNSNLSISIAMFRFNMDLLLNYQTDLIFIELLNKIGMPDLHLNFIFKIPASTWNASKRFVVLIFMQSVWYSGKFAVAHCLVELPRNTKFHSMMSSPPIQVSKKCERLFALMDIGRRYPTDGARIRWVFYWLSIELNY